MNRNDKCFCGSSKKYKKCHYGIEEGSIASELIKFYNELDSKIEKEIEAKSLNVLCGQGCSECCEDYFAITEVEFAVIMDYLKREKGVEYIHSIISKGIKRNNKFKENYPEFYKQLEVNTTGYSKEMNIKTNIDNMPNKQGFQCIFLNDQNECSIYKVRPIICREHGMCYHSGSPYDYKVCSKIPSILNNKSDMIDIDEYCNKELSFQYYKSEEKECSIERRKYPIFYFIKMYFEEERNLEKYLNHPTIKMIYRISSNKLADEIIKIYKYRI